MEEIKHVPKGWGYEKWICNSEEYCGKLLHIIKGKKCSWHYHKLKDEVFYLQSGLLMVYYSKDDEASEFYEQVVKKVTTILAFWFFNQASSPDEFNNLIEQMEKGEL